MKNLIIALFITFTAVQIGLAQSQREITGKYCAIYEGSLTISG
jgi:hypothetical protein